MLDLKYMVKCQYTVIICRQLDYLLRTCLSLSSSLSMLISTITGFIRKFRPKTSNWNISPPVKWSLMGSLRSFHVKNTRYSEDN